MHAQYLAMVRSFFLGAFLCAWHDVGIATCRKCILSDLSGQGGVLVDTPGSACGTFSASFGSRKAPCNRAAIPSGGHIPIRPRFRVWPRSHSQELLLHITKFAVAHLREMASPMPRHKYHQAATWFVRPMRAPTACRPVIPRKLALQAPNFVPVAPRVEPSHRKVQLGALQVLQAVPEPQASTQLHLQQPALRPCPKGAPKGVFGGVGGPRPGHYVVVASVGLLLCQSYLKVPSTNPERVQNGPRAPQNSQGAATYFASSTSGPYNPALLPAAGRKAPSGQRKTPTAWPERGYEPTLQPRPRGQPRYPSPSRPWLQSKLCRGRSRASRPPFLVPPKGRITRVVLGILETQRYST